MDYLNKTLIETRDAIRKFTANCREDLHEPDEQGIKGVVKGKGFDNANCPVLNVKIPQKDIWRDVPGLGKFNTYNLFLELRNGDGEVLNLNLADLVNLARHAKLPIENW